MFSVTLNSQEERVFRFAKSVSVTHWLVGPAMHTSQTKVMKPPILRL